MRPVQKILIFFALAAISLVPVKVLAQLPSIEVVTPSICALGKVTVKVINCTNCQSYEWRIDGGPWVGGTSSYSALITSPGVLDVEVKYVVGGNTSYIKAPKAVIVRKNPVPLIWLSKNRVCSQNDSVTIKDTTNGVVSREWFLENTKISPGPKTFKYLFSNTAGVKPISLTITDSFGCKGTSTADSFGLWNPISVSVIPKNSVGCVPRKVFYQLNIDTAGQNVKSALWTFQNGNPSSSTKLSPDSISYSLRDTHDLALTIITKQGCQFQYKYNNIIDLGAKSVLKLTTSKNSVCRNEPFTLTAQGFNNINNLKWTLSGAAFLPVTALKGSPLKIKLTDTGNLNVLLEEDDKGCLSSLTKTALVRFSGPKANFSTLIQNYCSTPDTLQFKNSSTAQIGGSTSYQWNLYEQGQPAAVSTGTGTDFQYITNKYADYNIMLIAKGSNGCNDTLLKNNNVQGGKINKNMVFQPQPACPGQFVTFSPGAGTGGTKWPNYYSWSFYNPDGSLNSTSGNVEPKVKFLSEGRFSVRMKVWNNKNCKDSSYLKDTISIVSPQIKINIKDTILCRNQSTLIFPTILNKRSTARGQWIVSYIDSVGFLDDSYGTDTVYLKFSRIGRYSVRYQYIDTTPGGCIVISSLKNYIKVSGSVFKITTANRQGCDPLILKPAVTFISTVNYHNNSSAKSYLWYTYSPTNATFDNKTILGPTISCPRGLHSIYMKYNNGSGCIDSSGPIEVESGVYSSFAAETTKCAGKDIKLYNKSNFIANNFKWLCDTPGVIFNPTNTTKEPTINVNKSGAIVIKLVASAPGGCKDTSSITLYVEKVKADFMAPDSIAICAPKIVTFLNNSLSGSFHKWYFGDGDSAYSYNNTNVSHIYLKNRPKPGYTVKLISFSPNGCVDSITKKGYVKILGPTADFDLSNNRGCEQLKVKFKNTSSDYNKFYLDFGDGSVLDSTRFQDHSYFLTDRALAAQVFKPKLALYDSNGCFVLSFGKDSIVVYKNAEARNKFDSKYFLHRNTGCAPLLVNFTDVSNYVQNVEWDFNNDGIIDQRTKRPPPWLYTKPGVYRPMNIAINVNGCRDTFFGDTIWVLEPPKPSFVMAGDTACPYKSVWFRSTSKSKAPIVKYAWKFGDGVSFTDTSSLTFTRYKYNSPFNHIITLTTQDSAGCEAVAQKTIYIADTAGPPKPKINFITVLADGKNIEFNWAKKPGVDFSNYHIFEDYTGYTKKYQTSNILDTTYTTFVGSSLNTQRTCYTYKTEDTCNLLSPYASGHCTIVLRDSIKTPNVIQLNWLAYTYWATDISHYELYRKLSSADTFSKIADIKKNEQQYLDSPLCDYTYCYYIEAIHKNRTFKSRSNIVCTKPIYIKPNLTTDIAVVTVNNNTSVDISWNRYAKEVKGSQYIVEKSETGINGPYKFFRIVNGLKTNDNKVEVGKRNYAYRVKFQDHCGNTSSEGLAAQSILLKDSQSTRGFNISWTPYLNWPMGVNHYLLQYKSGNNWITLSKYGSAITDTSNLQINSFASDTVCFRVLAIREGKLTDTSVSNWMCEIPKSEILLPNAFNPGERGVNKIFKAYPSFIINKRTDVQSRFEMHIYNRWGQQVFESFDYNEGWDGTFNGKPCQSGFYTVIVKGLGFDGVPHRLNQMIYLLR